MLDHKELSLHLALRTAAVLADPIPIIALLMGLKLPISTVLLTELNSNPNEILD